MKYQKTVQALNMILYLIAFFIKELRKQLQTVTPCEIQEVSQILLGKLKYHNLLLYEHIRTTLQKYFFYMSPTNENELTGIVVKYTIEILLKKVKSRSISVYKVSLFIFVCVCVI